MTATHSYKPTTPSVETGASRHSPLTFTFGKCLRYFTCLSLTVSGVVFAGDTEYPVRFFASKGAIVASAKAAFAGASVQELEVAKKNVAVLYRYASGTFSSDAAIYREENGSWRLLAYYAPVLNDSIEASAEESSVVLKSYTKKRILLTVSVAPEK
jgi:hypothetical protein